MTFLKVNAAQTRRSSLKTVSSQMSRISFACLCALTTTGALGQAQDTVTTYDYDSMGNVVTVSPPLGRRTYYSYDSLNRMFQQTQPVGSDSLVTKHSYDGLDQVLSVTDPRQLVTNYTIDGLANRSQLSSPDTQNSTYTVDEAGNVTTLTDARGKTTRFQYDALGRLMLAQYQSGTPSQFEYDGGPGGPAAEIGNLTRLTDESGTTTYTHDSRGRVLAKTQVVNAGDANIQFVTQYSYGTIGSAIGKLESITYPSGIRVNYHYGDSGRISRVTLNQSGVLDETPLLSDITYTPTGNVQSWHWGNTSLSTYQRTYDLDGRLRSYPTDLLGNVRTITYNAASLITAYTHAGGPNPAQYDQTFAYDTADRLTSFTLAGKTTSYSYDANGNRTSQTGPNVTYSYSATSNRLNSATFSTPRTYTYDAVGNRTGDGLYTYTYSERGRLAKIRGNATLDMYYNGVGQRVLKAGATTSTYYVYDEEGRTIGEYSQGNASATETVYLADLPIAVVTPQGYFYVLADQVNAPLVLAQSDGTTAWDWRNRDPFGNNAPVASSAMSAYDHRFPGQVADPETGLFYNYFRDYDPSTGRYVESDPIGLSGGINTYAYVGGNPASYSDVLGLLVTAVLDRNAGTLTVTDNDTGRSVTASAFTGGNTNPGSRWNIQEIAAPNGDYYIAPNVNQKVGHDEWFSLLQKKSRIDDTFFDYGFRRTGARLHWGGQSYGCVTVDKNTPGNDENWKAIRALILSTKQSMINYHPDYNSFHWRTVNLPSYGTLTIK